MPATNVRVAVYNPGTRKPEQKTFAFGGRSKRTEAEARRLADEWVERRRKELAEMPRPLRAPPAVAPAMPATAPAVAPALLRKPLRLNLSEGTGNTVVIVGSSKSGKTTLTLDLVDRYFSKYLGALFCVNAHAPIYSGLPRAFIRAPDFVPQAIKAMHKINKLSRNRYEFLAVLDDLVDERTKNNEEVRRLYTVYRNANISTLMCLQDCRLLAKTNRGNLNNVIFLKLNSDELVENVIRCFLSSYLPGRSMLEKVEAYKALTAEKGRGIYLNALDGEMSIF